MAEEPSEDSPSQQDTQKIEMTTQIDPSLRTDTRSFGSVIVLFLLFVAWFGYSSGDYSLLTTGSLLALAVGVMLLIIPYGTLRDG